MIEYTLYNLLTLQEYKDLTKINNTFDCETFTCSFKKNHTNGITFYINEEISIFLNLEIINERFTEDRKYFVGFDGENIYAGVKNEISS